MPRPLIQPIHSILNLFATVIFAAAGVALNGVVPSVGRAAEGVAPAAGGGPQVAPRDVSETPKFELDIMPLLTSSGCNAGACHGKSRGQNGFALSLLGFDEDFDYAALVHEGRGRRLFPAVPSQSLVLKKASGQAPHGGGIRWPTDSDPYRLFVRWIETGMSRATAADPKLVRIALRPEQHPLALGGSEQIEVVAHYSDGSFRDVTATSAFQSSEPAVVAVSTGGALRAGELPGEATIMARYMGHIATWSTAIARPEIPPASAYDALPRGSFIDELVWAKLRELNILPSAPISDVKFIRRTSLDLIGRLPTADEVQVFLADTDANKRERWVENLLGRPEYADFWGNKWADLIRPNPYRVGIKATLSLDQWLRDAFRRNMPMDQFARELVTARGSTWRSGAVTVFRDRRSPEEITTMMCQLLLGVRLECAKCHQHPFEVFGQQEFYGMAAFFSRVGYKGTGLSPPISGSEEIVMSADSGEVQHPLTGQVVPPSPLFGPSAMIDESVDRRERFADWLTSPENVRFAQAAANRLWGELFTVGIVDPVDDIRATNPPSNPRLLEALGEEYRRLGFNQKAMLKKIVLSHVYALESIPHESNVADTRNFSRHYRRLMRAEVLADAISDVTSVPDSFSAMPIRSRAMETWTTRIDSEFLDAFGRPDANQDPPCERLPQATMVQALHLMNAEAIQTKLANETSIVARLAAEEIPLEEGIEHLYLTAYGRAPTTDELQDLLRIASVPEMNRRLFFQDLLWSMINTPEFVYED